MKTAIQNIVETLTGKKVLFLERDNELSHGVDQMQELLVKYNITHKVLTEIQNLPFADILSEISECDAIVFQTRWLYEISNKIHDFMLASKDKKIVIECYISEPTWYYKPKQAVHDLYICSPPLRTWKDDEVDESEWTLYKLSVIKPYWEYKNKFNK